MATSASFTRDAHGITLVFLVTGIASIILGLVALTTRSYRLLSAAYAVAPESAPEEPQDQQG